MRPSHTSHLAVVGLINGQQDEGGTNPWLLMLDSLGFLTPGCGDGLQIVTAVQKLVVLAR